MKYIEMSPARLRSEYNKQVKTIEEYKAMGLKLDMSRGKPDSEQLSLSDPMLTSLDSGDKCVYNGFDMRNYGILDGIPQAKQILADMLEVPSENIIVCGNSSLNIMYDTVVRAMLYGVSKESEPWIKQGTVRFLCPSPGYDRHFSICQSLGIEMIPVPINSDGPDMDVIEKYVSSDPMIKGVWCVPKYSNPTGITYSDEVVRRFASLKPAAEDFRIFWDNAYAVHDLYDEGDKLLDIVNEAINAGNPDIVYEFTSTSKITFPGSGIACIAASTHNLNYIRSIMTAQTIGYDKLNMLRHVLFFKDIDGVKEQMRKHAILLRPKFEVVLNAFEKGLREYDVAEWTSPRGGYFISLDNKYGSAKRVWQLMSECGVKMTGAGATFPYGNDPKDSNLRIAPTYPPIEELSTAVDVLVCCVKIAALEKLIFN